MQKLIVFKSHQITSIWLCLYQPRKDLCCVDRAESVGGLLQCVATGMVWLILCLFHSYPAGRGKGKEFITAHHRGREVAFYISKNAVVSADGSWKVEGEGGWLVSEWGSNCVCSRVFKKPATA